MKIRTILTKLLLFFTCLAWSGPLLAAHHKEAGEEVTSAKIFAPGVISTGKEMAITFSPDSSVIYFSRRVEELEKDPGKTSTIFWATREGYGWSEPEMTPYSGVYSTVDPFISPDGSKIYIMTTRPTKGLEAQEKSNIWIMSREDSGWDPTSWVRLAPLGAEVNSPDSREGAPTISLNGNLYFFSDREGGEGLTDIYVSQVEDGIHQKAKNLGLAINSASWEAHPFIAGDESFLIFTSGREGGFGSCDLYISFKQAESWSLPKNLGPKVNTEECEMLPVIAPDNKHLFFTRINESGSNIYFIKVQELEVLGKG